MPWLADEAPAALSTEPTLLLALGAVGSYALFSLGWTAYGLAGLRAGVLPRSISTGIALGGVLGFSALLAPYGIPLGVAVLALGVWMLRVAERPESRAVGYVGPGVGPTPRRR